MKKNVIIAGGILLAGAGAIFLMTRKKDPSVKEIDDTEVFGKPTTASQPAFPTVKSDFPLTYGSRNNSVKTLQQALRVSVDGIFGSQTLDALKKATGKTSVKDASELNKLVNTLAGITKQNDVNTSRLNAGKALVAQKKAFPNAKLYFTEAQKCGVYKPDVSGNLFATGTNLNIPKNKTYNNFSFLYVNKDGFVFAKVADLNNQVIAISPFSIKLLQ